MARGGEEDGLAIRIAMWSGPRSLSTAMMRAWENRPDTAVVDEPFYACYLVRSGADHPLRESVIAAQPTDWRAVVATLTGPVPGGRRILYQKHMTHHMLYDVPLDWLKHVRSAFLIRHPRDMAASYARAREVVPTLADLGVARQAEIFDQVADSLGRAPPVVDADDVLDAAEPVLSALCDALDVPFDARMLHWPPGPRPTDGVWAEHWYGSVRETTGFGRPGPPSPQPPGLEGVIEAAWPYYQRLSPHRLGRG
jgi:hypothetical protein